MKVYLKTYLRMHNYNPDSALKEGKDLVHTSSDFWDVQDAACHVIGMTTYFMFSERWVEFTSVTNRPPFITPISVGVT